MKKLFLIFCGVLGPNSAHTQTEAAAEATTIQAQLQVSNSVVKGRAFQSNLLLSPAPSINEIRVRAKEISTESTQKVILKTFPLSINVIVDSSALCGTHKLPTALKSVFTKIAKDLHRETRVTVQEVSSVGRNVLLQDADPNAIAGVEVHCVQSAHSVSLEESIQIALDSGKPNLANMIWVYSSGNLTLSERLLKKMSEAGVYLAVVLYEPLVEPEVQPALATLKGVLADRVSLTVLKDAELALYQPGLLSRIEIKAPYSKLGGVISFLLEADIVKEKELSPFASTHVSSHFSKSGLSSVLQFILGPGRIPSATILALGLLFFLIKIYKPRRCRKCKQLMRFQDVHCVFCCTSEDNYLRERSDSSKIIRVFPVQSERALKKTPDGAIRHQVNGTTKNLAFGDTVNTKQREYVLLKGGKK